MVEQQHTAARPQLFLEILLPAPRHILATAHDCSRRGISKAYRHIRPAKITARKESRPATHFKTYANCIRKRPQELHLNIQRWRRDDAFCFERERIRSGRVDSRKTA